MNLYQVGDVVVLGGARVECTVREIRMCDGRLCAMAISPKGHRFAIPVDSYHEIVRRSPQATDQKGDKT